MLIEAEEHYLKRWESRAVYHGNANVFEGTLRESGL